MTPASGTYDLDAQSGDLLLDTTCEGPMAKMGHDLTLIVNDWHATLALGDAPDASSLSMTANLESLRVRDSRGGSKPAGEGDFAKIQEHAASALGVAQYPELSFASTAIEGDWESGRLEGQLTLHGQSHPQVFDVVATEGGFKLTGVVKQSRFGVKPFSTMMGALRLVDDVAVEVAIVLGEKS